MTGIKNFDWRHLQRLTNAQSMKDFDHFLDNLPQRAGKNALIIAVSMWLVAAVALFLLFHNTLSLQDIQKQLAMAEGTRITVPQISYLPVDPQILKPVVDRLRKIYPSLTIDLQTEGKVSIKGLTTRDFPIWRAAIGDLAHASPGWKLTVTKFCTGSRCSDAPLVAIITVQNVDIQLPAPPSEDVTENEKTSSKP